MISNLPPSCLPGLDPGSPLYKTQIPDQVRNDIKLISTQLNNQTP